MGGIARSSLIPGRVICTSTDKRIIIIASGEALFSMFCIIVNRKGSMAARSYMAGY
jgi:hypothetical protein